MNFFSIGERVDSWLIREYLPIAWLIRDGAFVENKYF